MTLWAKLMPGEVSLLEAVWLCPALKVCPVCVRFRGNQCNHIWCEEKPQNILHSAKLSKEDISILR